MRIAAFFFLDSFPGRDSRKAPAHMPHFVDKNIMTELQAKWPRQYEATSSNRFRHSNDMQMAFAYFYFVMNQRQDFDPLLFFREHLDLDGDGYLDESEIKYMAMLLNAGKRGTPFLVAAQSFSWQWRKMR